MKIFIGSTFRRRPLIKESLMKKALNLKLFELDVSAPWNARTPRRNRMPFFRHLKPIVDVLEKLLKFHFKAATFKSSKFQ